MPHSMFQQFDNPAIPLGVVLLIVVITAIWSVSNFIKTESPFSSALCFSCGPFIIGFIQSGVGLAIILGVIGYLFAAILYRIAKYLFNLEDK